MQIVPRKPTRTPKPLAKLCFVSAFPSPFLSSKSHKWGMLVNHTLPLRASTPAAAVHLVIESIGKHSSVIHHAIAIPIDQLPHAIGIIR